MFVDAKSKAYITALKSDIRNLVSAEESFFADSSYYTTNLTNIGFKQSTGTRAPTIVTYAGAWLATNSHTQLLAIACGIGVNTTNPRRTTAGDREPACQQR